MDTHTGTVRDVHQVGGDTISVQLDVDGTFDALPGQFVLIEEDIEGEEESSYYTISSPEIDDGFEVTVGVDAESVMSVWLSNRNEGDAVKFRGPFGNVKYDDAGDVLNIAEGPGIGPALAISERAVKKGYAATVIYQDDNPAHKARLDSLETKGQTVKIFNYEEEERLKTEMAKQLPSSQIFIFGFSEFCNRVNEFLENHDQDTGEIHVESFG